MNQNITKQVATNLNEKNVTGVLGFLFGKKVTRNKRLLFILPFAIAFIQRLLARSGTQKK
ncbi:MAG: hypothetical protein KIH67_001555 [Candidatus Moranbacteria bacterium]|nr:hypothetical protein [Candidatus Moranbacteria bacterium]